MFATTCYYYKTPRSFQHRRQPVTSATETATITRHVKINSNVQETGLCRWLCCCSSSSRSRFVRVFFFLFFLCPLLYPSEFYHRTEHIIIIITMALVILIKRDEDWSSLYVLMRSTMMRHGLGPCTHSVRRPGFPVATTARAILEAVDGRL